MSVGLLSFAAALLGFNRGKSQTNPSGTEFVFLNIAKSGQGWSQITGGSYPDLSVSGFNFDANGYPRNIVNGGVQSTVVIPADAERSWSDVSPGSVGAYTMDWDGGGTVVASAFTLVSGSLTSSPGSTGNSVTLRPTSTRPTFGVSAVTSSTDYPHNIRLYYTADKSDINAGKILSKQFRSKFQQAGFGVIRFLNWGGTVALNFSGMTTWSTRKPVGYAFYNGQEPRTSIYAGPTTNSGDDFSVTFTDPIYGSGAPVDKQQIIVKWSADQTGPISTLTYNGQKNTILNVYSAPANPLSSTANSGVPANGQYSVLFYDALLQGWFNFGSGNLAPGSAFINNGVPPEAQLQAAIELGAQPYFITPPFASDAGTGNGALSDFMPNFVDMVKAGAPSWMTPIWEGPNEDWNTIFYATSYAYARQLVRYGGPIPGKTSAPFVATSLTFSPALTITGAANNGSGLIRLTVSSTASLATDQFRTISGVVGTVEANGVWPITVIDGTHFDLQGSAFAHAWASGGTVSGSTTMQISGALPPVGAMLTTSAQPSTLFGFSTSTGYVTAAAGGAITLDTVPNAGTFSSTTGTATLTLVGSTVTFPFTTVANSPVVLATTGSLPAPLVAGTVYYVKTGGASGTPFQISATAGGAAIDFSAGSQSGTQSATLVIALTPASTDTENAYGITISNLGQLLASKYGISQSGVATQTKYKVAVGVKTGLGNSTSGTNPRLTSKNFVLASGNSANMSKFWATHVAPANYFLSGATNSGAQETALANAWNGTFFTAGVVNGVMTVASFQNAGTTNMANGQVVFGQGMPAPFPSGVTIVSGPGSGTGVYTLSDLTINLPTGTQLYSGADATAVQAYIDGSNDTQFVATIDNGSGASGNQMVVSSITPIGPGVGSTIYLNAALNGVPITASTSVSSQSSGTTGGIGTYTIGRNYLVTTPTTFTTSGSPSIQLLNTYLTNWKAWALGFDVHKMLFYEGGWSPDYITYSPTAVGKIQLLKFATKWMTSSPGWSGGMQQILAQTYSNIDALTDGTFTAEYPSCFQMDGRYPSTNVWSVYEDIYGALEPPQITAIRAYNTP